VFTLLGARMIESLCVRPWRPSRLRRQALLTGACVLATLLNPYGWQLHRHLIEYLRSDWIRQSVEEFQSPRFRSESMLQFEILLLLGIAILPALWRRRRIAELCLILFWAQEALGSVRHVPIYCVIAAPVIALEIECLWKRWAKNRPAQSFAGMLRQIEADWKRLAGGFSVVPLAVCLALVLIPHSAAWPEEFPSVKFPTALVSRNSSLLASSASGPIRVFSSDQWSDYLIYRLYPRVKTFFDGRSDFFGPWRGDDYSRLMEGRPGCPAILDREKVRYALLPSTWALAGLLAADPNWSRVDGDRQAVLFRHRGF